MVSDWFDGFVSGFFGPESPERNGQTLQDSSNLNFVENFFLKGPHLRIYKRSLLQLPNKHKQVITITKRDIKLPSFGDFGDIVNDMANTLINTATVWKYQ